MGATVQAGNGCATSICTLLTRFVVIGGAKLIQDEAAEVVNSTSPPALDEYCNQIFLPGISPEGM